MATYSIDDLNRRDILKMSAMVGLVSVVSTKFAFAQAALYLEAVTYPPSFREGG